jgi:hypothetical protein
MGTMTREEMSNQVVHWYKTGKYSVDELDHMSGHDNDLVQGLGWSDAELHGYEDGLQRVADMMEDSEEDSYSALIGNF